MTVIVFLGGPSAESDVSLRSGLAVMDALRRKGYPVRGYDPVSGWLDDVAEEQVRSGAIPRQYRATREVTANRVDLGRMVRDLRSAEGDAVFNVLHGRWGEDGTVQAILETLAIPYTGSGVAGSALAMDKMLSKRVLRDAGVPVAPAVPGTVGPEVIDGEIGFPCIVKPSNEGSSVGLSLVRVPGDLEAAIRLADRPDAPAMVEAFIPGREFSCGILGGVALEPGEVIPNGSEVFDFSRKYQTGGAAEVFPAEISYVVRDRLRVLAERAHQALGLRNYSRIDFRMNADGELICLEANTLPGMTPLSLLPLSARAAGIDFDDLVVRMLRG